MDMWAPRFDWRRVSYLTGMVAIILIVAATLMTALVFSGPRGDAYSILNRKISTLGHPQYSGWAMLFNWGLRIGGGLLIIFITSLGLYVRRLSMVPVVLCGVVLAGAVVGIGVCPVNKPVCHEAVARTVFGSGLATTFLFTLVLLLSDQRKLSRWLALPSGLAFFAFILFMTVMFSLYENPRQVFIQGPVGDERPYLWLPSLLEWLIFATVVAWVLTLVGYLYYQEQEERHG